MNILCVVERILFSSLKNLFLNQPDIFNFTSQTGQTEWNLCHHLANEIHKYIFWLDHDLDVTKRNLDNKRPDIIFHKRGINELNFLVVEVKYKDRPIKEDMIKIKKDWMGNELHYRFGASIKFYKNERKFDIFLFETLNSEEKHINQKNQHCLLPIPNNQNPLRKTILNNVEEYASLVKSGEKPHDIEEHKEKIDQLIYHLYKL